MMTTAATSAPGVLPSGDRGSAVLRCGYLAVLAPLVLATVLAMPRRSQAGRRGIRLLGPVEPGRGPVPPATGG